MIYLLGLRKAFWFALTASLLFTASASGQTFNLDFPINGLNPFSPSVINSVSDRSLRSGSYNEDGIVEAYSGEVGEIRFGAEGKCYKQQSGGAFVLSGNYRGARGPQLLCYDGHPGVDFAVNGASVRAAADGVIVEMRNDAPDEPNVNGGLGNYVKIDHGNGYISIYGHLRRNSIPDGLKDVIRGQEIGTSGNSGASTGPHLHFELRRRTNSGGYVVVDPYSLWDVANTFPLAGGTFFDRTLGLIGTSFLADPITPGSTIAFFDVAGPLGWNSNNPIRCHLYRPPGTASNRSICWEFILPVSGQYVAQTPEDVQSSLTIDAANRLAAPEITNLNVASGQVTITWTAAQTAHSFLVRVNTIPFPGFATAEMVVSGRTRTATFSNLALTSGQQYQAVIFAFSHDVQASSALLGPFNISAHAVSFNAPGTAAPLFVRQLRAPQQPTIFPPSPPSSKQWP